MASRRPQIRPTAAAASCQGCSGLAGPRSCLRGHSRVIRPWRAPTPPLRAAWPRPKASQADLMRNGVGQLRSVSHAV